MENASPAGEIESSVDKTRLSQKVSTNFVFFFAIFIIFILSFISVYQFHNLANANRWVKHTYQVILTVHDSLYYLTYLESSQRGYLLFDDKNYLPNRDNNILKIKTSLNKLAYLTQDNPPQEARILKLADLMNKKINLLNQMLQIKSKGKLTSLEASNLIQTNELLSEEIRFLANEIVQVEFILLSERNSSALKNADITNLVFISGQVISIVFLLIAFMLFNSEISKRRHAEIKIKNIEDQLRGIIEGASDMIAALDLNYRYIIFNQAYEREFKRLFGKQLFVGMSLDDALENFPEVKNILKASWQQSLAGNEYVQNIEFEVYDKKIIYEVTSSLIKDGKNKIIGAVHIKRNITERIRNENLLNEGMYELKDKNEKITLLLEMSDVMLACNSLDELSNIIAKYCNKILSFSKGVFYLMHPSKDFLETSAKWGSPISNTSNFTQDQCWGLRLGHIYEGSFSNSELICKHVITSQEEVSYLCVPLRAQNDIYGLLYVEVSKEEGKHQLTSNERLLVNAFAELAALALANVRLRENLSYQSIRDPLTSLYNRRYLEEFLLKQIYQSERSNTGIAVLMLDLDHFKRINDIHGHEAGDLVLKEMSQLVTRIIRPGDMASRYGGEEFIIILYDTNSEAAVSRAEEIRKSISSLHVRFGAQETGEITVSIGIAVYPSDGKTGPELIEAADKALYVAKNSGRNRVVLF